MKAIKLMILLMLTSMLISQTVNAQPYQSMAEIADSVKAYLMTKDELQLYPDIQIQVQPVDKRLNLAKCNQIKYQLTAGSRLIGKTNVRVMCESPKPWSFYVSASISIFSEVYALNSTFNRGHIIRQSDVYKIRKDLAKLPFGYISESDQIIGKEIKRNLQAGRVVTPSHLRNPLIIKRGEIVSLQNQSTGFTVQMRGVAMMNGAEGDRVRVKNSSSNRIVEGVVNHSGVVIIGN